MKWRSRISALVAAMAMALTGVLLTAAPASAAGATWNYIVMPTWQGNCPSGGSVIQVYATSWSASTSGYAADGGDDIVYLRVGYRENVNIVANV